MSEGNLPRSLGFLVARLRWRGDNRGPMSTPLASPDASEGSVARHGRYRRIADIGRGGTASVHLAVVIGPGGFSKLVVIKSLLETLSNDPAIAEMFLDEARLAARLNHPNIVQTYEVGEEDGRQILVMEYLDGQPLSRLMSRLASAPAMSLALHLKILCDTLAGLHHAHELEDFAGKKLGLVHRDVSPQNVFVTYDGQVKLLDFGIAKATAASRVQTETGVLKGKVRYMAPEHILGDAVDRRADVYAVGVMLWEAIAGKPLWDGVPDIHVINSVANGEIPSLRATAPDVNPELERICTKAMAPEPADRYATAHEFQLDLECAASQVGNAVKERDVGVYVAQRFADERLAMRATIDAQLRGELSAPAEGLEASFRSAQTMRPFQGPLSARWKPIAVIAAAMVATLGAGFYLRPRGVSTSSLPESTSLPAGPVPSTSLPAQASASSTAAVPAPIELKITVSPRAARIFFDGRELSPNPFVGTFPPDDAVHNLRVEAPGHIPRQVNLSLAKSSAVSIALERHRPAPARLPASAAPIPAVPPSTVASAAPDCAQPYFVNAEGIKKIRLECL